MELGKTSRNSRLPTAAVLLLTVLVVVLALSPLAPPPAHAVSTPTVFVAPASHAVVAKGAHVNFWINYSGMPQFNGFNILVKVNNVQLTPTSISTTGLSFATPSEDLNCVNDGVGITAGLPGNIGCVAGLDGPGIAHEEVFCLGCVSTSDHGLLFNVTFTGVATSPTGSVVDVYNDQIDTPPILAPHVTVGGMYGTAQPDFSISASPFSQSIAQGRTGSATLSLTSVNGFAGTLALSNSSVAAGTTNRLPVKLSTTSVALTAGATQPVGVTISPTPLTPGGVYDLILNASGGSPNLIHQTDLNITVTMPDFSIVASPTSLVNPLGSSNSSTLTLTSMNTFTGKVTLSFTVIPNLANGPTITLSNGTSTGSSVVVTVPSGGTVSATLTVSSTGATAPNSYSIKVTGVSGSLSRSTSVSATVFNFSLSASPVSVSLTNSTGSFATSTITITSLAPSHINVTFSSATQPSTSQPIFNGFRNATTPPGPGLPTLIEGVAAGGTSQVTLNMTVTCGGLRNLCTAPNIYTVKVIGAFGTTSRTVFVTATVTAAATSDFTISATSPVNFNTGATGAATTVTVTAVGTFTGTITLTPTSPAGLTTACPASVVIPPSPNTASCTFTSITPGVYGVTITGTSGTHTHAAHVTVHVGDFSISATSPSGTAGSSISSTVTLTSSQNFVGSVALSDTPLPAGLTCNAFTVTPVSLTANGTGTSSLSCSSPTVGTFVVSISASGTLGTASHPASASFTFVVGADFSVAASSPADFSTGATGSSTVTVTPSGGFTGAVTLNTVVSPATGLTANCPTGLTVTGPSAVTGTCNPSSSTPGTYLVTITGTGGGHTHSASFVSHVGDFAISVSSSVNFNSGATGSVISVSLTSTFNFAGTIGLTPIVSPAGLTVTCPAPVSIAANATVAASCTLSSAIAGTYGVTITGAGSPGTAPHSAVSTVHVGDFTISATSPSGAAGSSISSTITLTSTFNFVGSVALSDTPLPAGLTCSAFTVTPVSLTANGTGTSSLSCSSPTTGTFSVTIAGAGSPGTASHSTSAVFTFTVGADFAITASSPADFNTGATGSSTITITPSGGFTGSVVLTTVVSPATGLAANCPPSLTVVSGAVTGTCAPSSSTPGTYLVTITGTGGGHTHSASFVSHVGDFSISVGSPVNFNSGATGSVISVSLTSTFNFAGTIGLTPIVSPAGLTVTCPGPVSMTANATVAASCTLSSTTAGTYGVSITGAGSPGAASHSAASTVHVGNFTISVGSPVNFNSGATGSAISVSLTSTFNFAGTVTLAAVTSPVTGLTVTCPAPVSITANATVAASCTLSSTTAGTYGVTINGTGSPGTASHSAASTVHVGNFTISVSTPVNFNSGATGSAISVSLTSTFNFAGTVSFAAVTSPATGLTVTCPAPVSITANATVGASCTLSSTTAGTYGVTVTGTGSPGTASHSAASTVHVGNFTISVGSPVNFNSGATGSAISVSLTSTFNFAGTVSLAAVTGPVTGLTVTCPAPVSITANATVTASCSLASTAAGTYGVTVTGAGSPGTASHSAVSTVHVGDFSISATSPSGAAGSSISSTIILTSTFNFVGTAALSDTPLPAGLTCNAFTVTPVSLAANGTGTSSLSCTSSTTGSFVVNISAVGTPGTASHPTTATFTFTVGADFSITASSPADFNTGATGSSTITITPSGGFTGTVLLTTTVSPSTGLAANCPASLTVTSSSPVTGTCSPSSSIPGTYDVSISASGGGHTHPTGFVSHVGDFTISATGANLNAGQTGVSLGVSLTSTFNFAGSITLTGAAPAGLTITCPATAVAITANATVTSSCSLSSTTAGTYAVSVSGAGSPGTASHSAPATVHVGDFSINASSPSGAVGSSISSTITLTSTFNFVGSVVLGNTVPAGLTCQSFSPSATVSLAANGTGTANLSCTSTAANVFNVNLNGVGSPGTASHSTTATFTFTGLADFTISATSPADFNTGATGSSTITITPIGSFTGAVTLTAVVSPSTGLAANCPASLTVTSGAVTGTCAPSSSTPGTYLVTITGTGGGHTHSTIFISHVGDFTISATGHDLNLGETGPSVSVSLTSTFNFAGTISLTAVTGPVLACVIPASITANATVAAFCTLSSTTAGTFGVTMTVAGSPGTAFHSAPATVHVGNFSISATSPSGVVGSSISSTVTLTSMFNFAGAVALMDTVPSGLTCQPFSPSSTVSLSANGTGTASLSCTSATANAFNINISGVGSPGTASHSTTATFNFATVSGAQLSSAVTDGNLCGLGNQFRLIFVQSHAKSMSTPVFTLAASSPGQFAYNVFLNGTAGTPVTLSMSVPYPFVTQGTNPVQVFSNFGLQSGCFVPINNVSNSFAITPATIALMDYGMQALGSTVTITVSGSIPSSGMVYLTVHLNYGLKGSSFGKSDDNATNPGTGQVVIPDDATYSFSVSASSLMDTQTVMSENVFKQDRVIAGIITDQMGSPVANIPISLFDSGGNLVAMAFTDADGFVGFHPHISGKSTFTVESSLPDGTIISQIVTVRHHHLEFLSFSVTV